jgi:hypothetical protein
MTIGDLLFALGIDGSRLEQDVTKEAQKAGDAGAKTMTQRLSRRAEDERLRRRSPRPRDVRVRLTKGALELEDVQNDFQSETGASAEEAKRAGR